MPVLQKNVFTHIKEWLLVTLGILIYVTAWSVFLIPNNLIGGGVSGISSMIQYATGGTIQMGYSYFVLNAILVAAAVVILGMGFGAKTIYAIILASIALRFLPGMVPTTIIKTLAIDNGKLLSVLMGGLLPVHALRYFLYEVQLVLCLRREMLCHTVSPYNVFGQNPTSWYLTSF